jgi:hypothetical protein
MNDIQVLTICITLLGIFAASWFNNSRMGDLSARIGDTNAKIAEQKADLGARISDTKEVLRAEMKAMEARIDLQFQRTNNKIDELLKIIADHDQRIAKLEAERR